LVPEEDIQRALIEQQDEVRLLLQDVSDEVARTRHPPYTWSVKEVLGHILDAERIFGIRALRFGRSDPSPLPSFDENAYVPPANFNRRPLSSILEEFLLVRQSYVLMFRYLDESAWGRSGVASNASVTVRALAYIMVGHARHHLAILRKRLTGSILTNT
jgi:hypothetical protein